MSKRICVATLEDLYTKGIDVSPLTMFGSENLRERKYRRKVLEKKVKEK